MTRDVICYITNNTPYEYYSPATNLKHGQKSPTSAQPIMANQNNVETFSFSKTTGSYHGVTGSVTYTLNDGSTLFIGMNCPYDQEGNNTLNSSFSNCWFYAGITNVPSSGTAYWLDCNVSIGGEPMDPTNPTTGDTITASITINNN